MMNFFLVNNVLKECDDTKESYCLKCRKITESKKTKHKDKKRKNNAFIKMWDV